MSNGIWGAGPANEKLQQGGLTRHRILQINLGTDIATAWQLGDASGLGSVNPNTILPGVHNTVTDMGPEGGPHFVFSPETPDGSHTYGFEFCLMSNGLMAPNAATPAAGGFTVTVWALISNSMDPQGNATPTWASYRSQTGVQFNEMYHSFDCNATAIRFQITNAEGDMADNEASIQIALAEL